MIVCAYCGHVVLHHFGIDGDPDDGKIGLYTCSKVVDGKTCGCDKYKEKEVFSDDYVAIARAEGRSLTKEEIEKLRARMIEEAKKQTSRLLGSWKPKICDRCAQNDMQEVHSTETYIEYICNQCGWRMLHRLPIAQTTIRTGQPSPPWEPETGGPGA